MAVISLPHGCVTSPWGRNFFNGLTLSKVILAWLCIVGWSWLWIHLTLTQTWAGVHLERWRSSTDYGKFSCLQCLGFLYRMHKRKYSNELVCSIWTQAISQTKPNGFWYRIKDWESGSGWILKLYRLYHQTDVFYLYLYILPEEILLVRHGVRTKCVRVSI